MKQGLSYNFPWYDVPKEYMPRIIREFLDWGVKSFVFTDPLACRCLEEPELKPYLQTLCRDMGVEFVSMHGICGYEWDLDITDESLRPKMLETHVRLMELAKEFGSLTYTIHVGAAFYCRKIAKLPELRVQAKKALDVLVPEAKRIGIVLAVENSFEPPNSCREVLDYVTPFGNEPAIGVCYDVGHANIMRMTPGKEYEKYRIKDAWYETGVLPENDGLEILLPHIVTTHIHDNDGYGDSHAMPFDGNVDWDRTMQLLRSAPRMLEFQTEVCYKDGENWSGPLFAPKGGYSIKHLVETFRKLGFCAG